MDKSSVVTEHEKQYCLKSIEQSSSTDINEDDLQGIISFSTELLNSMMIQYGIQKMKK